MKTLNNVFAAVLFVLTLGVGLGMVLSVGVGSHASSVKVDASRMASGDQERRAVDPVERQREREYLERVVQRRHVEMRAERERLRQEQRTRPPVLDWEGSNLLALLLKAFRVMGYEGDAMAFAQLAYHTLNPDDEPGGVLDWRNSNPVAVFRTAFISAGFEPAEATGLAVIVLEEMGYDPTAGREHEVAEEIRGDQCHVYPVQIIYCDGDQRKKRMAFINNQVWDTVLACPKPINYVCTEADWYTMRSSGDCGGEFLPEGTCFWIRQDGDAEWVSCSFFIIQRNCVIELDPTTDCQAIEIKCASENDGPDGCPCEDE